MDVGLPRNLNSEFDSVAAPHIDPFFLNLISYTPVSDPSNPRHAAAGPLYHHETVGPSYHHSVAGPSYHHAAVGPSYHHSATGPSYNQASEPQHQAPEPSQDGYDGGPTDTSVLVSFSTHIAKARWDETDRDDKVLRLHKRWAVNFWSGRLDPGSEWVSLV